MKNNPELQKIIEEKVPNNHIEAWSVIEKALKKATNLGVFELEEAPIIFFSREIIKIFLRNEILSRATPITNDTELKEFFPINDAFEIPNRDIH
jgi:hypothetical protein